MYFSQWLSITTISLLRPLIWVMRRLANLRDQSAKNFLQSTVHCGTDRYLALKNIPPEPFNVLIVNRPTHYHSLANTHMLQRPHVLGHFPTYIRSTLYGVSAHTNSIHKIGEDFITCVACWAPSRSLENPSILPWIINLHLKRYRYLWVFQFKIMCTLTSLTIHFTGYKV